MTENRYRLGDKAFGIQIGSVVFLVGLLVMGLFDEALRGAVVALIGIALALMALLVPRAFFLPNRAWGALSKLVARYLGPVFLGAFFFLVLSPIAILRRRLGSDPLQLRDQRSSSFWKDRREEDSLGRLKTMY